MEAIAADGTFLYAGEDQRAVWRQPLTVTAVLEEERTGEAPPVTNAPNPFVRGTTFQFTLRQGGPVRLTVYDAAGRRVDTAIDRVLPAGSYAWPYDASHLLPGVYFYRLDAEGRHAAQKMIRVSR
jgi:hypothetical protein